MENGEFNKFGLVDLKYHWYRLAPARIRPGSVLSYSFFFLGLFLPYSDGLYKSLRDRLRSSCYYNRVVVELAWIYLGGWSSSSFERLNMCNVVEEISFVLNRFLEEGVGEELFLFELILTYDNELDASSFVDLTLPFMRYVEKMKMEYMKRFDEPGKIVVHEGVMFVTVDPRRVESSLN